MSLGCAPKGGGVVGGGAGSRPQRGSGFLREVEVVECAFAGSAELDGVDVGRRRLGAEGVEALPGGLGAVEGAGVGDAARGDVAKVRHLAAAGDGEVVQEVPLVAEGGEGGELGVVVEAEVAEEGADDGAVLLLDAVGRGGSG